MNELNGMTALVTGSGKGLGRAIALVLAEQGADVIINDINESNDIEDTLAQIRQLNRKAWFVKADVTKEAEVKSLFLFIEKEIGKLDVLINNAGTDRSNDIFSISLEEWNYIMTTNLTSCFLCSKYAMQLMKNKNFGRIVNISSVAGQNGTLKGHVHYSSSKSAMYGFTKTLARTGAPIGINVNTVAPGLIESELSRITHGADGLERLRQSIPLGLGTPRDVGLSVAFLCGEGARYITGITLDVNGGLYFR